ncbi:uncharacterized protein DNG_06724 [Cephalotrichum gorgonifer]|uniref:Uncharacterized protein n=1 Tax=Cephalotrichum gorgonifer TaxID=2041049 RepID=A0AAE8N082_9PEZI|nr:uncharacterized protein DNG_06724 [Cephalotrichum gorgonifer]
MRSNTIAILGLIATAQALPTRDRRQFELGDGSVDFSAGGNEGSPVLVAPGFQLPPGFKLPPGITFPRKRVPQGGTGGGKGGHHGGNKGDHHLGKPDEPIETPVDPPQESPVPEHPEYPEYPEYPEEPEYPEHEVTILDIIEAQQKLAIMKELIATLNDPVQKAAIQRAIEKTEAFLLENVGVVDPSELPKGPIIFAPGGRHRREASSENQKLYDTFVELTSSKHKPSFALYMVAEQILQILLEHGFEIDPTLLSAWARTSFTPRAKRQDGIFALPGSCDVEDIIGLETTLATLLIIYGNKPPPSIASLRNAVTAALIFCKTSQDPVVGGLIPEEPEEGGALVPEKPVEGGSLDPEKPVEGGSLDPEKPVEGGALDPEEPEEGGALVPEKPVEGGELDPEEPIEVDLTPEKPAEGGEVNPEEPIEVDLTPNLPDEGTPVVPVRPTKRSIITPNFPVPGGPIVPNIPGKGSPVVPVFPTRRGIITPNVPIEGGSIVPNIPDEESTVTPVLPTKRGIIIPNVPIKGGAIVPDTPDEESSVTPVFPTRRNTITPNVPVKGGPIVPNFPNKGSPVLVFPTPRGISIVPPAAGKIVIDEPEAGGAIVPAEPVASPDLSTGDEEDSTIVVETPAEGSVDPDETQEGNIVVEEP